MKLVVCIALLKESAKEKLFFWGPEVVTLNNLPTRVKESPNSILVVWENCVSKAERARVLEVSQLADIAFGIILNGQGFYSHLENEMLDDIDGVDRSFRVLQVCNDFFKSIEVLPKFGVREVEGTQRKKEPLEKTLSKNMMRRSWSCGPREKLNGVVEEDE